MYKFFIKRTLDIIMSVFGLLILSPIFLLILLSLFIYNSGSPLFFQSRPGKNEKIFKVIKFKTMTDKKGQDGLLLPDAERLTKIGTFIRKTSLDEIPQLFNVLIGDMSIIGPRPLLPEYLELYNDFQKRRHSVRPGITGWAQVNGRNAISWEKKFEYDVWYTENLSFILDIKIVFKTILKVIKSEDINSQTAVTTTKFLGTKTKK
ncbi:MAG: sugar transferase [Winogradskyella sp.]|uniref:sugar transferase n=1 Tax=Winogradskyella sp. TaxID=1883156 RepID=UPI000F4163C2|nr:sugar transferase [Winogradskyella sp.]RNC88180.1 MAG: sugar transferase [Winogradskyella sp.]